MLNLTAIVKIAVDAKNNLFFASAVTPDDYAQGVTVFVNVGESSIENYSRFKKQYN